MVSMAAESLSDPKKSLKDLMERGYGNLISKINQLQEEIEAERTVKIKEKLDKNQKKLQSHVHENMSATHEVNPSVNDILCEVPSLGNESALCIANGFLLGSVDKELANIHEVINAKTTKLPKIERIPPYTTWVFLDRNQRMAEDQSVVGRRRIYYDQSGNEALICSESEDDTPEVEEDKREFSEGEDRILRMAFQEHGSDDDVAEVVSHFIGSTPVEVKERYLELKLKLKLDKPEEQNSSERNMSLEKSLSAVLDSFDNLFCRRCLVFDCRLHGCSQNLVYPSEKQSSLSEAEDRNPCSDHCYLLAKQTTEEVVQGSDERSFYQMDSMVRNNIQEENKGSNVVGIEENVSSAAIGVGCNLNLVSGEGPTADVLSTSTVVPVAHHANIVKRKIIDDNDKEVEGSDGFKQFIDKKSITIQAIEPTAICGEIVSTSAIPSAKIRKLSVESCQYMGGQLKCKHPLKGHCTSITNDYSSQEISCSKACDIVEGGALDINRRPKLKQPTVSLGGQKIQLSSSREWKPLEKDLYVKGLEIFGRNSCLIARNLLSGLKTCNEVSDYMCYSRALMAHERDIVPSSEDNPRADIDRMEQEVLMRSRSRIFRKRGRSRRLKYSTKSNGHPSSWKSNGDGDQSCKQYTPCTCESTCGKDCSCLKKGTCCEKYCGCSKNCKNRFRGCHCAKSQCRSRQCPCFAANRECDPDVCRNCWVSCGGGPLGEPPKKGDGQCGNMRLLLRQQQRILLGKSDVAGWGAFIKNSVNKHDYLGEYTGELISHREADKRGKIYDRANSSFLFDLNDQYVLDACRHGDKLKFANHSSKPNCYCKVMLVAGDHRVGIFAKERIEAKEELFYDYRYGPDQAPAWARRPEAPKKDDYVPSQGRARKHQSR